MLLTTLGASYEPVTPEGRLLAWLLALFAFSIFGYITATLASLFVEQDRQEKNAEAAAADPSLPPGEPDDALTVLVAEVRALRSEVRAALRDSTPGGGRPGENAG